MLYDSNPFCYNEINGALAVGFMTLIFISLTVFCIYIIKNEYDENEEE